MNIATTESIRFYIVTITRIVGEHTFDYRAILALPDPHETTLESACEQLAMQEAGSPDAEWNDPEERDWVANSDGTGTKVSSATPIAVHEAAVLRRHLTFINLAGRVADEVLGQPFEVAAEMAIDSCQVLIADPCVIDSRWKDSPFEDVRIYERADGSGKRLQYRVDFENYASPIQAEGGRSMNELNEAGVYKKVEIPASRELSYNGACQTTLSEQIGSLYDNGYPVAVATHAGQCDGTQVVYAQKDSNGRVLRVLLDFTDSMFFAEGEDA